MQRWNRIAVFVVMAVAVLAIASYLTTSRRWSGGFPPGEIRISLRDNQGDPVDGAVLRVYHKGTRDLAFEYPLENHVDASGLVSDDRGRITAIKTDGGTEFGGHSWELFWIIPFADEAPEYDCEIIAEGFQPLKFKLRRLFESPHVYYEEFPKTMVILDGKEVALPVSEPTFTFTLCLRADTPV